MGDTSGGAKKRPRLRPDLPGGRAPKRRVEDQTDEEREAGRRAEERHDAMTGRSDDRRHKPQKGETGRKKKGFGDQGAWN